MKTFLNKNSARAGTACLPGSALILSIILGVTAPEDAPAAADDVTVLQPEGSEEITRRRPGEWEDQE